MNAQIADAVLDSSAILAWLNLENGGVEVGSLMPRAIISAVNLTEVVAKLTERGETGEDVQKLLDFMPCPVVPFDAAQALAAGLMRSATGGAGLSLGDRACLALASARSLPAWTADRAWAKVDVGVDVRLIR